MRRLLLTSVVIVLAAAPILANDEQDCFQSQEPQLRIKGCSKIIQRDPNDATAYHNRAAAYGLAGDIDNAIADYTKVIEIAPNNVSAYDNRGSAYASKGDYTRAIADEIKTSELIAKATTHPTVIAPKAPKTTNTPKSMAAVTTATTIPPNAKALPKVRNNAGKEAPGSSWWSWLWGDNAAQANVKKTKP